MTVAMAAKIISTTVLIGECTTDYVIKPKSYRCFIYI